MERFATLEPVKLYAAVRSGAKQPTKVPATLVGRLPADLHLLVVRHLPIPDIAAYSRCSRATAAIACDESIWEKRWKALAVDKDSALKKVLDDLEQKSTNQAA